MLIKGRVNYVSEEGTRAELKELKDLSVGTWIEPQRNPSGLGLAISNFPTHCISREFE